MTVVIEKGELICEQWVYQDRKVIIHQALENKAIQVATVDRISLFINANGSVISFLLVTGYCI